MFPTLPFLLADSKVRPGEGSNTNFTVDFLYNKQPRLSEEAFWRGGRVVEGARLLSECTAKTVPRVQIPPSPFCSTESPGSQNFADFLATAR